MVSAKPNKARLAGTVREVRADDRRPDRVDLVMTVDRADDVEGDANLLAHTSGQELTVTTDARDLAELGLERGDRVVVDAEVRGPGAVWSRPRTLRRDR